MQLRSAALAAFPSTVPESLATRYGTIAKPMFNWIGLLMTNTRMLILFVVLILDRPAWYFIAEVTALNLVLVYVLFKQSQLCRLFLPEIQMTD
jgi:hypothetical protein